MLKAAALLLLLPAASRAGDLAADPAWRALLHFEAGARRSEAGGPGFFLAPDGGRDPQAELEADLEAFRRPEPSGDASAQCRLPARFHWLKERGALDGAPVEACPRFAAWREQIDPGGATLVFANAFLGNPSSMFGHTFLRLRRSDAGKDEDLLDYTINYAGDADSENFLQAFKGVTGLLRGKFDTDPYYLKIQEYTNMESRDVWEYDLGLSKEELDQLLRDVWELRSAAFQYRFFTGNCSYEILTLLDVARPGLRLADDFRFGVVPGDTVRAALARPGLVTAVRYRPSNATQLLARRARLSPRERALAYRLGASPSPSSLAPLEQQPPERRALALDSAHDLLRYRHGFSNDQSTDTLEGERLLLVARGRTGVPPLNVDIPEPPRLTEGHDTARWGFGAGASREFGFEELSWRPALHDSLSPDLGYLPDSQLEVFDARLRFDNRDHVPYVERLNVVGVQTTPPWDRWTRDVSWKLNTGIDQAKELHCGPVACMHYDADFGLGLAAESHLGRREAYFAFAETDFGAAPVFSDGWRLGAGGTAGIVSDETAALKTTLEATYIGYLNSPSRERLRLIQAWRVSRDSELRLTLDRRVPDEEAGLAALFYF